MALSISRHPITRAVFGLWYWYYCYGTKLLWAMMLWFISEKGIRWSKKYVPKALTICHIEILGWGNYPFTLHQNVPFSIKEKPCVDKDNIRHRIQWVKQWNWMHSAFSSNTLLSVWSSDRLCWTSKMSEHIGSAYSCHTLLALLYLGNQVPLIERLGG